MRKSSKLKKSIIFAFLLLVYYFGGSYLSVFLMQRYNIQMTALKAVLISQIGLILLPVVVYFICTRENVADTLKLHPMSLSCLLKVILFTFCIQPLVMFVSALGNLFFTNYTTDILTNLTTGLSYPAMLLVAAVCPAIVEECATRGVIMSGFKGKPIIVAAIVNGLIFAILHGNIQQGLYAFILGFVFVYLVNAAGSIFASMTAHFIINATSVTMMYGLSRVYDQISSSSTNLEASVSPSSPAMIAAMVVLGILAAGFTALAYLVYRSIKKQGRDFFIDHSNTVEL